MSFSFHSLPLLYTSGNFQFGSLGVSFASDTTLAAGHGPRSLRRALAKAALPDATLDLMQVSVHQQSFVCGV